MKIKRLFCGLVPLIVLAACLRAQDTQFPPAGEQIPGPDNAKTETGQCCYRSDEIPDSLKAFHNWIEDVRHWRNEQRIRIGYDGLQYERPQLLWAQSSFIQPQMMVEDRYFYDPVAGQLHRRPLPRRPRKRYGGIDCVLVWHTYPNIGIDNRDQYDLLRDMPGGVEGLRQMVQDFHRRGVRVLFPGDAVGPGNARPGFAQRGGHGQSYGGNRRRWDQRRHAATACRAPSARPPTRPATRLRSNPRAGSPPTKRLHVEQSDLGLLEVSVCAHDQPLQVARAAPHGERLRPLERATRRTTCRMPSSTAWGTRAGRTSGASGTRLRRATPRPCGGWPRSNARSPELAGQPGLGAAHAHAALRRVCQHVSRRGADAVDDRQSQPVRRRGPADLRCLITAARASTISGTAWN